MRRLELVEGTANKFWQVEQAGSDLNLQWGRIGTAGQSQTKTFSDEAEAAAALATLVAGKLKKGYAEVAVADVTGPAPTTSAAAEKKAAPAKNAVAPAAPPVAESLDDQADRAVVALCAAIAAGEVGPSSTVTPALTRRLAGGSINDHAAKIALERLHSLGVVVSYWSGNYRLPEQASERARQTLAELERQNVETPATVVPAPQAPPSTPPGGVPPWLAGGRPIRLAPEMRALVYASRRVPGTLQPTSIDEAWQRIRTVVAAYGSLDQTRGDATYSADAQRLTDRLARREVPAPDRTLDAMLVVLTLTVDERFGNIGRAVVDYLLANHGLLGALDVWLAAQRLHVATTWTGKKSYCWFDEAVDPWPLCWDYSGCFGSGEETLRKHLAAASEEEWRVARDAIVAALPSIHPRRRPALAMLLPDAPEVSDSLALGPDLPEAAHYLLLTATDPAAIAALTKVKLDWHLSVWERREFTYTLLAERGLDAVEVLALHAEHDAAGEALACIGTPEAVAALARVATSSKGALANLTLAVDRWPLAAVAALARQVALGAKADVLMPLLAGLLRAHDVTEVRPWLEPAAAAVVDRQLALLAGPTEVAAVADLPPVLAAPPWLAKTKKTAAAALILEPLPIAPVERWDAGVRERAAQDDQRQQRRDAAAKDVLTLVRHLGFDADKKHLVPLGEAAARAIRHRDTDALVAQWRAMVTARKEHRYWWYRFDASSVSLLPQPMAAPFWNAVAGETETGGVTVLMAVLGVDGLPGLVSMVRAKPADHLPLARSFGAVELAPLVARAFAKLKTARQPAQDWLLRYPEHAAAGLVAPALGKAGEARDCAGVALRFLAAQGHEALIVEVAGRYGREDVSAGLRAVLDENPLDRFPTRRARLPEFWQPAAWHRPVLHDGKALPDSALDALGQMLTFPTTEGVYAGIDQVKQACTPGSLADFAWDLFSAWLAASAPAKEGWALRALGLLGDDDTARRLTPYIRAWPGESAHARAVNALDVLATIGTDVALMQLNGIAQKLKFKGLQDKAREKITAIAEDRELTLEELDDRLAPDLGLDERGTMLLDFGPRVFTVGFDESLRPYVRQVVDGVPGPRLANLPKPRQSDDPELAKAATTAFRALKKDARTIASQQVLRLETAMCTQRRWTPDLFQTFLVDHPLVRHLVQRLLWGVYRTTASHGGDLLGLFRVAEDGSFTTADDDPYEIPAGDDIRVGIPHALAITDADAAAFGQLFADYELMQPFAQMGRDTYTLTDAERLGSQLLRWKDVTVPTGRVLGLVNKGWRRGEAQDGGGIWYFTKPLDGGRVVELDLDPGIIVGMVDEYPDQVLGKVQVGRASEWGELRDPEPFSTLDAVAASELVRDMEALTAP